MRGFDQAITLNTDTAVDVARLKMSTNLQICNETGATLYVLVDGKSPSNTNAHFAIQDNQKQLFAFDNVSQMPGVLYVRSSSSGHIHLVGW